MGILANFRKVPQTISKAVKKSTEAAKAKANAASSTSKAAVESMAKSPTMTAAAAKKKQEEEKKAKPRSFKFPRFLKKGGMADKTGRAMKKTTADAKGRAMTKAKRGR